MIENYAESSLYRILLQTMSITCSNVLHMLKKSSFKLSLAYDEDAKWFFRHFHFFKLNDEEEKQFSLFLLP